MPPQTLFEGVAHNLYAHCPGVHTAPLIHMVKAHLFPCWPHALPTNCDTCFCAWHLPHLDAVQDHLGIKEACLSTCPTSKHGIHIPQLCWRQVNLQGQVRAGFDYAPSE